MSASVFPAVWAAAAHWNAPDFGASHCTCYPLREPTEASKDKQRIHVLEKELSSLRRTIFKLTRHKRFKA